jgi:hypothetical protein
MANDDRNGGRDRPERMGDRNYRGETDNPDYGAPRYGSAATEGYGSEQGWGPQSTDADGFFSAPGFDAEFAYGPRFDRQDVGSTGTHGIHPVSSPFGAGYGAGFGAGAGGYRSSARRFAAMGRMGQGGGGQSRGHDPHYSEWRNRQVEQLDRDYDEYCRERQSTFDREFGEWRERRGRQRQAVGQVREQMEVVGSDGSHVGTVDGTSGDSIVLTKNDPNAGGVHHFIPCSWVETVDDKVRLNLSAEDAMNRWRDEQRNQALFERQSGSGREREDTSTSGRRGGPS